MATMKQWVTNQDGLDKLQLESAAKPTEVGEGQALVKIKCVGLNYRDTEGIFLSVHLTRSLQL
jgi:NADPH:quinone reductase-like Zn-dependent oxidoreductase